MIQSWTIFKQIKKINLLYSTKIFFYSLIWLIVLLLIGTVAQKDAGLYLAQQKYFSSWFFFWNHVPFPSGRFILAIIFFNLLCKILFNSPICFKNVGVIITHIGSLLLLIGGCLTAYFSIEGSMFIPEGQSSGYFEDYYKMELALINTSLSDFDEVTSYSNDWLVEGETIQIPDSTVKINIINYFPNVIVSTRTHLSHDRLQGMAKRFEFTPIAVNPAHEKNIAGLIFEITGFKDDQKDGIYMVYQYMEVAQTLQVENSVYTIALRNQRYLLPFKIKLIDFEQKKYPGTEKAKSYKSDIVLQEKDFERKATIQMNEPFRYLGYTFYQSSFVENKGVQATVLAVVKNRGRLFPYISSIIICIGLLIHLLIHLPRLIENRSLKKEIQ